MKVSHIRMVKTPFSISVVLVSNGKIAGVKRFKNGVEAQEYAKKLAAQYDVSVEETVSPIGPIHLGN